MTVPPERWERWTAGFAERHGPTTTAYDDELVLTGSDGATALVEAPFPPLVGQDVVAHCLAPRRVGVLMVRLGGHAAGVFDGAELVVSKVGSRQVHGRSAAGGWSQQRFARRREGQVAVAHTAAADVAVRALLPERLDAVVLGGERTAAEAVLADRRLAALRPLVVERFLDVPDPRLAVLQTAPALFRAIHVRVRD